MLDKTYKLTRLTVGNTRAVNGNRNIFSVSYGYTNYKKLVSAGSTTAVMTATSVPTAGTTFTTSNATITNPDVPRCLTVTVAASTAAHIAAGNIVVTGRNVEGKVITETFAVTNDTAATINGTKAFKSVTSVLVPVQDGSSVTVAVGTRNILGLNHRLPSGASAYIVEDIEGFQLAQGTPTLAQSTTLIESNTITPASTPDGTATLTAHYIYVTAHLNPTNGNPSYGA